MKTCRIIFAVVAFPTAASAQYTLFSAESFSGSLGSNTALFGGVDQYLISGPGSASLVGGLSASQLSDPVGLRYVNGQLFVGNRNGNQAGVGSISIFDFNGGLTFDEALTGNGLERVHGLDVSSTTGELFASQVGSGVRRFLPDGASYSANGGLSNGNLRDALVSEDGSKLYQSTTSGTLLITDLGTSTTTSFTVAPGRALHQMAFREGTLYVAGLNGSNPNGAGEVYAVELDASSMPVSASVAANVNSAIGVAFSPDGTEMLVSQHTLNSIQRLSWNGSSWDSAGTIVADTNLGYLASAPVPEPATLAGLAAGALLLRRRRKADA